MECGEGRRKWCKMKGEKMTSLFWNITRKKINQSIYLWFGPHSVVEKEAIFSQGPNISLPFSHIRRIPRRCNWRMNKIPQECLRSAKPGAAIVNCITYSWIQIQVFTKGYPCFLKEDWPSIINVTWVNKKVVGCGVRPNFTSVRHRRNVHKFKRKNTI